MYSTIKIWNGIQATPQGRCLLRAGVGFELAIKRLLARCLDHWATTSPFQYKYTIQANTCNIPSDTYTYSYHCNGLLAERNGMNSLCAAPIFVADLDA